MKVILVNGSPHEHGCTYTALREAEKALNADGIDTEIFWLGKKPVSGCIACGACRKLGKCFMEDAVNEFTALAKEADGFIFGSPVHYASAGGAITSFMDRAFYSGGAALRYKPAAAVASCRRAGGTATLDMLNKYFTISCVTLPRQSFSGTMHTPRQSERSMNIGAGGKPSSFFMPSTSFRETAS